MFPGGSSRALGEANLYVSSDMKGKGLRVGVSRIEIRRAVSGLEAWKSVGKTQIVCLGNIWTDRRELHPTGHKSQPYQLNTSSTKVFTA